MEVQDDAQAAESSKSPVQSSDMRHTDSASEHDEHSVALTTSASTDESEQTAANVSINF